MQKHYKTYALKHGYANTRYADDLTFSGERPPEAGFFESVTRITGEHGFILYRRKTRLQKSIFRRTVTGIVANQKPNIDREYKWKLRAQLDTLDLPDCPVIPSFLSMLARSSSSFW